MNQAFAELSRLRMNDPDVNLVLSSFEDIERIYRELLESMGMNADRHISEAANSAKVTISFRSPSSSAQIFYKDAFLG